MPRLVTVSRAAKLAGVSRGNLQKRIRDGDIPSFEGMVKLDDVMQQFPAVDFDKNTILERLERIIDNAAIRARNKTRTSPPSDIETLASRVNILSDELVEAKLEISIFYNIVDKLKTRLNKIADDKSELAKTIHDLQAWLLSEVESVADKKYELYPMLATDTFLRVMAAQVRLEPSGHEFFVEGSNSILEAGLSAGLALNYGCSNGNCGKCKCKVITGETKKTRHHDYVMSEKEKLQGYILACSHTAVTDVVLEADVAGSENDIPQQSVSAWIRKIVALNDRMSTLHIKTPRTQRLRFLAGQTVKLEIPDVAAKTLHVASCPCDDMHLQFHIEHEKNNPFVQHLLNTAKPNDIINIYGPNGHFILHEDHPIPIVFIAFDKGFAPIKSLIEHALTLDITEHIKLYRLLPNQSTLYMHNHCRSWADAFEHFDYELIEYEQQDAITSLTSSIQKQLKQESGTHHYYIAGSVQQIATTKNALHEQGIEDELIFCEEV